MPHSDQESRVRYIELVLICLYLCDCIAVDPVTLYPTLDIKDCPLLCFIVVLRICSELKKLNCLISALTNQDSHIFLASQLFKKSNMGLRNYVFLSLLNYSYSNCVWPLDTQYPDRKDDT
jgi:hypothetical protein